MLSISPLVLRQVRGRIHHFLVSIFIYYFFVSGLNTSYFCVWDRIHHFFVNSYVIHPFFVSDIGYLILLWVVWKWFIMGDYQGLWLCEMFIYMCLCCKLCIPTHINGTTYIYPLTIKMQSMSTYLFFIFQPRHTHPYTTFEFLSHS